MVEVGFGKGWRLGELSGKNPERVYIGMEVPRELGKVDALKPNVILEYNGGLAGLQKLPNESISSVMMDLVLEDTFVLTGPELRRSFPGRRNKEFRDRHKELGHDELYPPNALAVKGEFQFWKAEMLKQVKRVLKPDGTLEVNTSKGDLKDVEQLLGKVGFIYDSKPASEEEVSKSWYMRTGTEFVREGELDAEQHQVMHITARKIPEKRELRLLPPPLK